MSFHLIPYNLGCGAVVTHQTSWLESTYHLECGASCDSSDILVLKHRCDNMTSGGVNDDLGVKACVTAAGSVLMRQVQDGRGCYLSAMVSSHGLLLLCQALY